MEDTCPRCGADLVNGKCEYCGYEREEEPRSKSSSDQHEVQTLPPQPQPQVVTVQQPVQDVNITLISDKSKLVALLLCFFLGWLGIHRFYAGKIATGVIYFFTLGLFGIGWFIDLIMILLGSFRDSSGLPIKE